MTYPSRRRGNLPNLHTLGPFPGLLPYSHQMQLASLSKQEIGSFYQTWLFFGLIHEILGDLYVTEDLIYTCENACGYSKAVSTSKLIIALEQWVARVQAGTVDPPVTYVHAARCLCLTQAALYVPAVRSNLDPNIMLSLASLGQTFTYAANMAFKITDIIKNNKCPNTWRNLVEDEYWNAHLLAHGWCVTEIKLILDTVVSLQTLHFFACFDKTDAKQSHRGCDMQQCRVYQNDLSNYQTQHVSKECDCKELSVDPEALYRILRTKALPLIRVRPSQSLGELSVDIVASRPKSRYVALSHVWADGLGNPNANALPRCQLADLAKLIQRLDMETYSRIAQEHRIKDEDVEGEEGELLLWCDTLCCPVHPKEAKHLALEYMYQTYRYATYVLVLDATLRRFDNESLEIDEVSMRVMTSPWMRRLWTIQEGALPAVNNRLWFQLAHKAMNLRDLRINARDNYFSSISRKGLAVDVLQRLSSFAMLLEAKSTNPGSDLRKVIDVLHHRSVSVPSDEPLLIGNLLGLDSAQILNDGAVELRMNRLWRMISSAGHGIPSNLLFRVGPRLVEPGLRWAPATLLLDNDANIGIQSSESKNEQGILTALDGLLVRLHGFRLSLASRAKGLPSDRNDVSQLTKANRLWMKDEAGLWYLMRRSLPVEQDRFLTDKALADIVQEGESLWIIYPGSKFPLPPDSKAQASVGLVVEVETEEEAAEAATVKKAHAKLHIIISPVSTTAQAWYAAATAIAAQLASDSPALRKLAAEKDGLDEHNISSSSSSFQTTALEELASEIHHSATTEEAEEAMAAGDIFNIHVLEQLITMVLWGEYVCMGETVPRTQQWCVD